MATAKNASILLPGARATRICLDAKVDSGIYMRVTLPLKSLLLLCFVGSSQLVHQHLMSARPPLPPPPYCRVLTAEQWMRMSFVNATEYSRHGSDTVAHVGPSY